MSSNKQLGRIAAIYRYPVKSMAGETLEFANVGWHGIDGDRRFAFRRLADKGSFPWLSASKLPNLLLYKPFGIDTSTAERLPTHVRTPDRKEYELRSDALRKEVSSCHGSDVELMNFKHGIFDEASISLISLSTMQFIAEQSNTEFDVRRFRPNVVLETENITPFAEDEWVGRTLKFGNDDDGPAFKVTLRDERCVMVNFDPDTAEKDSEVMKTVVRLNENFAGVYATVVKKGELRVGQVVTSGD